MKKIVVTLAAIAALSTAALADGEDLRIQHREFFANKVTTDKVTTETAPLAVEAGALTAFERTKLTVERNEGGGNR